MASMVTMQLATYIKAAGISLEEFARRIGAKNGRTVQRYTKHGRIPSGAMMARIQVATDGKVQPADFLPADAE